MEPDHARWVRLARGVRAVVDLGFRLYDAWTRGDVERVERLLPDELRTSVEQARARDAAAERWDR